MTESKASAEQPVETRIVEHLEATALPDTSWVWRRGLIYLCAVAALGLAYWVTGKVDDILTLRIIARYSLGIVAFCLFLYIGGASAEDVVRLVGAIRTSRRETHMSAPAPATATPDAVVGEGGPEILAAAPAPPTVPPWERK